MIRAPGNREEARWRPLEHALPWIALAFTLLLAASYGSLFGFRTETVTRAGIFAGFLVAAAALGILFARRATQSPEDYQRIRWVIWGCLIGLPAFLIAELASETTIFETRWGDFTPREDVIGLLDLINGVLCLFVFQALRRPRVVSVMIPLRRVTILGLSLSLPVLLLHEAVESMQGYLPGWAWLLFGALAIFLITRLHEVVVHLADRYFNRALDAVEAELTRALLKAKELAEIDHILAHALFERLKLASAASFRKAGRNFVRGASAEGWDGAAQTLAPETPLLEPAAAGASFDVPDHGDESVKLPAGLARPIFGVPAASPIRCYAVSFYGPHAAGTDLDDNERSMLERLAAHAATMYAEIENTALRSEIGRLERRLKRAPSDETARQ